MVRFHLDEENTRALWQVLVELVGLPPGLDEDREYEHFAGQMRQGLFEYELGGWHQGAGYVAALVPDGERLRFVIGEVGGEKRDLKPLLREVAARLAQIKVQIVKVHDGPRLRQSAVAEAGR